MLNSNNLALLALLLSTLPGLAQFGQGVAAGSWEPLAIRTKAGIVADWNPGMSNTVTLNGAGISQLTDRSWVAGRNENLFTQSSDFTTGWTRTQINGFGATDTGAAGAGSFANTARTTDPLGGNTADFIQEDSTASGAHRLSRSISNPASESMIFSVYAKADARSWVLLYFNSGTAYFNLTNGVLGTATGVSASIESAGGGWYRCSIEKVPNTSDAAFIAGTTTNAVQFWNGDNASGIFLWGAQLRRATSSTNYVATTTAVEDASRNLLQATAANQPLISRTDNSGNLLVQSETFATTWSRTRLNAFGAVDTGAAGVGSFANTSRTTDPLGGNTADFIQEDTTAANTHLLTQTSPILAPGSFKYSVYVKPSGRTWVRLYLSGASGGINCYFDIQNGIVGTAANVGTGSSASGSIASSGNGWYLCTLSGTLGTQEAVGCLINIAEADNDITFDGDNTSGLYLWGASLRQSTWNTNYIATVATPAIPGLNNRATAYFDGAAYYLKANAFTWNQPEQIIAGVKQWTWSNNDSMSDGNSTDGGRVYQTGTSPSFGVYAGSSVSANTNLSIGAFGVTTVTINGASSSSQVNNTATITGNAGANNLGGFTLGASGGASLFANIQVSRVIGCSKTNAPPELQFLKWGIAKNANVL